MDRLKFAFLLVFSIVHYTLMAQNYPVEWKQYTSDGYVSSIQSDNNQDNKLETDFKNYLINIARTNLAQQIKVKVSDYAQLNKVSINGNTGTIYSSTTSFSTDLNLKLVETKAYYNAFSQRGYAIAYINKNKAISSYEKDIRIIFNKVNNAIAVADTYIETGFKTKARSELENVKHVFRDLDEPFFWLSIFDYPEYELKDLLAEKTVLEQTLVRKLANLQHGINVYINCSADMFGVPYLQLSGDIKESLSSLGCNFLPSPSGADWVVTVRSAAEEYNKVSMGANSAYFSYIHANLSLVKTATGQKIYEGELSEKGSHTHNYNQAARDGYKNIVKQISEVLKNNIR